MSAVGVVIPVRDGERYLGEAIASALDQDPRPAEVVVVDDGSTDSSGPLASAFGPPVRVVSLPPSGIAEAVNRGIAETESPLVALLDADDLWAPGKLRLQLAALDAEPTLDAVFGYSREFASPELEPEELATLKIRDEPAPFRSKSTMLARRELLDRIAFDPRWRVGDFVDWHLRAQEAGMRSAVIEEVVLYRRIHRDNLTRMAREARIDFARIARAALLRRGEVTP